MALGLLPHRRNGDLDGPRHDAERPGCRVPDDRARALRGGYLGYLAAQAVEAVAREVTGHARREKRRRRMIDELRDHFIICGFGRVGRRASEEFAASGQPFVVLDFNEDALAAARERDVLFLEGRGAEDD